MNDDENNQNENQGALEQGASDAKRAVTSANEKRKSMEKIVTRATSKNAALRGAATVVKGFLIKAAIVILIIIFVVGIIAFFLTIPGMIMENLKALAKAIGDKFANWFGKDEATFIERKQVYEVLDYLEQMGYGLKEDGFLTDYVSSDITDDKVDEIIIEDFDKDNNPIYVDVDQGVLRNEDEKVIGAHSDFVMQYLISDNYMYTIRNFNVATGNWFTALGSHLGALFTDSMNGRRGMITLYHGNKGKPTDNAYDAWERGSIEIDAGSKKLRIKRGWLNNAMEFSLDGWAGRYGMPLEFLLSVHAATMMPDLAYDMEKQFDTEVRIELHESNNTTVTAQYDGEQGLKTLAEIEDSMNLFKGGNWFTQLINNLDDMNINSDEFNAVLSLGLVPPNHKPGEDGTYQCGCTVDNKTVVKINGFDYEVHHNDVIVYKYTEDVNNRGATIQSMYDYEFYDDVDYYETFDKLGNYVQIPVPVSSEVKDAFTFNGEVMVSDLEAEIEVTTSDVVTHICSECENYIKQVLDMLKDGNDYHFYTYIPYIAKVRDHWYRDVYFIVGQEDEELNYKFVDYDYDYESLVKERWTLYKTWVENDPDGNHPELVGYQKLYEVLSGGTLKDSPETDVTLYQRGGVITDKDGNVVKRYVKKAVTNQITGTTEDGKAIYKDLNWNDLGDGIYSAYDFSHDNTKNLQKYFSDEDLQDPETALGEVGIPTHGLSDEELTEAMGRIYVDVETATVLQTGDGLRRETNNKIKDMFINNYYFRYDHSLDTAERITKFRKEANIPYGPVYSQSRGIDYRNKTITIPDPEDPNEEVDIKAEDLAGHVELNSDNLAAFNMLENTHTLDADYIYRDFKELVVELGYFDKKDLTDGTAEMLEFPVPEIGSGGYPKRFLDKNEHTVGTLLHSKKDYDALEASEGALIAAIQLLANEVPDEEYEAQRGADPSNPPGRLNQEEADRARSDLYRAKQEIRALTGASSTQYTSVGAEGEGTPSKANLLSLEEWWEESQKMFDIYKSESWTYEQDHSMGTFEEAHTTGNHTTDCSLNASWMLQKMGALQEGHTFSSHMGSSGSLDMSNACAQDLIAAGAEVIVPPDGTKFTSAANSGMLEPGDTLFYDGHVSTYCGDSYKDFGKTACWDTGSTEGIQCGGPRDKSSEGRDIELIVRLMPGKKAGSDPFEGYNGNEAVVSPVTGILLEYGTYGSNDKNTKSTRELDNGDVVVTEFYRTNVDLKYGVESPFIDGVDVTETSDNTQAPDGTLPTGGVDETTDIYDRVGYAKILVLNQEYYEKIDSSGTYWKVNGDNYVYTDKFASPKEYGDYKKDPNNSEATINKTVTELGYKEFLEDYSDVGIDGYIVYIDGFLCETPDTDLIASLGEDSADKMYKEQPKGDNKLTMDDFRIDPNDLASSTEGEKPKMLNLYEPDKELNLASETARNKQNVEVELKTDAFPAMEVDGAIFIKEGTVLGRTMTDKELIEGTADGYEIRKNDTNDFEYYRVPEDQQGGSDNGPEYNADGTLKYEGDKVMGNYLRIQFFDRENKNIENVEDYMKLDDAGQIDSNEYDWEFFYWVPYESGPVGEKGEVATPPKGAGASEVASWNSNEVNCGISQWTTLRNSSTANIQGICDWLNKEKSQTSLAQFATWQNETMVSSFHVFQSAWTDIYKTNPDEFLNWQMEYTYDYEYTKWEIKGEEPPDPGYDCSRYNMGWLLDRPMVVQGTFFSCMNYSTDPTRWCPLINSSMSDEQIIEALCDKAASIPSTAGSLAERFNQQKKLGLDILHGTFTEVEDWVRTKNYPEYDTH